MVKPRSRTTQPTEQEIEAFGNMAEQPRRPLDAPMPQTLTSVPKKRKEPKVTGYNFRMSASEKQLLSHASGIEDLSEQKILERLVWPVLWARYPELRGEQR